MRMKMRQMLESGNTITAIYHIPHSRVTCKSCSLKIIISTNIFYNNYQFVYFKGINE